VTKPRPHIVTNLAGKFETLARRGSSKLPGMKVLYSAHSPVINLPV
jgi:hypothetical protein